MRVAVITSCAVLYICGLIAMLRVISLRFQLQHDINRKLPPDRQFEPTFWSLDSGRKFRQLQAEILPNDPRVRQLKRLQLTGMVLFLLAFVLIAAILND